MRRSRMAVDTLYYSQEDDMYFLSPDGIGCYWYDTREEAFEQHGEVTPITVDTLEDY